MDRVDGLMAEASKSLAGMEETQRLITEDMLKTYFWYMENIDRLTKEIDEEGSVVSVERGGANNRHKEMVENPKGKVIHKYTQRKSEYYTKIMRALGQNEVDALDGLDEFIRG